jgi:methanogenic corrinoid protein MtbC1
MVLKNIRFDTDNAGEDLIMGNMAFEFEQALKNMDRVTAQQIIDTASATCGAISCVDQVVLPALERIGRQWEKGAASLALVYMSGCICEELVDRILPPASPQRIRQPKTAIAVLEDFHVLGKSIIYSVLRASGIEVQDFGTVNVEQLVNRTIENDIKILLISVLMFASARRIKDVCNQLKARGAETQVIVGGAPFRMDDQLWNEVGADAVGTSTTEALHVTQKMIKALS